MVLKQVITETSLNYMKKDGIKTSHHRNRGGVRVLILFIIYLYINFLLNLFYAKLFFNEICIIFIYLYDLDIGYK